jgi:hypothetical protein
MSKEMREHIDNFRNFLTENSKKKLNISDVIVSFVGDVVDKKSAKKLKKVGFNLPTFHYYLGKELSEDEVGIMYAGDKGIYVGKLKNYNNIHEDIYSAPTREELDKWKKQNSL